MWSRLRTPLGISCCTWAASRSKSAFTKAHDDPGQDILVVGGGILGVAVAYHAARLGARVTLAERSSCGCEASGLSAGTLWNAGLPRRVTASNASLYLRAHSSKALSALPGIEFQQSGALDVAATPAEAVYLRADHEACVQAGLNVEWVEDHHACCELEPALAGGTAICAVHTPLSGSVNPGLATRALAAAATSAGCTVLEGVEVVSLRREAGTGIYEAKDTNGQTHRARHVVLAAGAWVAPLAATLGLSVPVVPVKGVICSAEAAPGALKKVVFDVESRPPWLTSDPHTDPH